MIEIEGVKLKEMGNELILKKWFKGNIIKKIGLYGVSLIINHGVLVIYNFLLRSKFEPGIIGYIAVGQTIFGYLDYFSHLGSRLVINVEIPINPKREHKRIFYENLKIGSISSVVIHLIVGLITLITVKNKELAITILFFVVGSLPLVFANYLRNFYRAQQNVKYIALYNLLYALIITGSKIIGFEFKGFPGFLFSVAVSSFLFIYIYNRLSYLNIFSLRELKKAKWNKSYLKMGIVMLSSEGLNMINLTIDKWIVLWLFGNVMLGIYSTSVLFLNMSLLIPNAIITIIYVNVLEKIHSQKTYNTVMVFLRYSIVIFLSVGILVALLGIVINPITRVFLPKYLEATEPAKLLLVSVPFISLQSLSYYVISSLKRYKFLLLANLTYIPIFLLVAFIFKGYGVYGVSMAVVISRIFLSLTWFVGCIIYLKSKKEG